MRRTVLAGIAAVALLLPGPARAAAPRYILVSGPGLSHPVILPNWAENLRLLTALLPARRVAGVKLGGRPRFDLALFWGRPARPRPTTAGGANQHGLFYPATRSAQAVVALRLDGRRFPRVAPREVLRILYRRGVRTKVGFP